MKGMKLCLLPLALLVLAMPAMAASGDQAVLTGSYDSVSCHTAMEVGVISSIDNAVQQASLSSYGDTLTTDTSTLQGYATSGDTTDFRSFLRGTYEPDLQSANQAIRGARQDFRQWNVSKDTILGIRQSYNASLAQYQSCNMNAIQEVGNARVTQFQDVLSNYTGMMNALSAKGVDTSGMSTAISNAQNNIVTQLQSALSSATTAQGMRQAIASFCLADGCPNGTNGHFYANFAIAKEQGILNLVSPNATADGLSTQVSQAQSYITSAQTALTAVGTDKYDPTQEQAVWNNLQDAASSIKGILKSMRNGNTTAG
jgi:hypothetical protein